MPRYAFKFISGKYQGGEFPIPEEGELLIGRSNDLDLVLAEDMVSRKHAKLTTGSALSLTDLGSTNGTFVNGEKIRRTSLKRNDRILIGTSILKVIDASEMTLEPNTTSDQVRAMMEELGKRETHTTTMAGDLEEVPLPDLLQLFATNRRNGVLSITGANRGKLFIKEGQLKYASITDDRSIKPMKALGRMLAWTEGNFVLEPYDEAAEFPETLQESTESLLMESLRQLDEMKTLQAELPERDATLSLCVPMTPRLADLQAKQLDTLQMVINFGTFQSVLDRNPETDYNAAKSVLELLRGGYLEVELEEEVALDGADYIISD